MLGRIPSAGVPRGIGKGPANILPRQDECFAVQDSRVCCKTIYTTVMHSIVISKPVDRRNQRFWDVVWVCGRALCRRPSYSSKPRHRSLLAVAFTRSIGFHPPGSASMRKAPVQNLDTSTASIQASASAFHSSLHLLNGGLPWTKSPTAQSILFRSVSSPTSLSGQST